MDNHHPQAIIAKMKVHLPGWEISWLSPLSYARTNISAQDSRITRITNWKNGYPSCIPLPVRFFDRLG